MTTDFSGLIQKLEEGSAMDILNSFGFPAIQPLLNLFYYVQYQVFGLSPLPWYLLFTTLFFLNGVLVFVLVKKLAVFFEVNQVRIMAFFSGLIFLSIPYQSEPVVWKVGLSYHLVTFFILLLLITLVKWLRERKKRRWWIIQLAFVLALFSFELAFAAPFLAFFLFFLLRKKEPGLPNWRFFSTKIFLPLMFLLAAYLAATQWVVGTLTGHYKAAVPAGIDPLYTIGNFFRYFFKYLLLGRYWPGAGKQWLFQEMPALPYLIPLAIIGISLVVWLGVRYTRLKSHFQLSLLLMGLFFIALLPAITLYFNTLLFIENDRYGYLASAFFSGALVVFLFGLPKIWRYGLLSIYLLFGLWLSRRTNNYWQESAKVFHGLIEDFNYKNDGHVFLLNLPDNLNGAVLFRDYSGGDRAFYDALKFVGPKETDAHIHEVVQYNLTSRQDGVKVERLSPTQLKVTFRQWGNWWWRRGQGAADYENEWYRFENKGMYYLLEMKKIPENSVFLYQQNGKWFETK